jgi:peptidylprolyl isomerase
MAKYQPIIILLGICLILVAGLSYWSGKAVVPKELTLDETATEIKAPLTPAEQTINNPEPANTMNPIAVLETNKGTIEIELYQDTMPITAGNFAKLVQEGFYNGIKFHRVIDGFMIQSGDPLTKEADTNRYGTGGPGYAIADEHIKGDLLTNVRGTISMANSGPNSGGSQFFINLADNTNLDFDKPPMTSQHPVFGRVVKGMDIVDAIGHAATNERDLPIDAIVIEKATLVTPDATTAAQ